MLRFILIIKRMNNKDTFMHKVIDAIEDYSDIIRLNLRYNRQMETYNWPKKKFVINDKRYILDLKTRKIYYRRKKVFGGSFVDGTVDLNHVGEIIQIVEKLSEKVETTRSEERAKNKIAEKKREVEEIFFSLL